MSNIAPVDPESLRAMRQLLGVLEVTPDMVQRGLVAYHNFQTTHFLEMGHYVSSRLDPQMIEEILRAALGGDG